MADHLLLLTIQFLHGLQAVAATASDACTGLEQTGFIDSCVVSIFAAALGTTTWCLAYCVFTTTRQLWPSSSGHWDEHLP